MRRLGVSTYWTALVVLASSTPCQLGAQTIGTVEGKVIQAESGRRLAGVTLTFLGTGVSVETNDSGSYGVAGLPPGVVTVRATLKGYATAVEPVTVSAGEVTIADFRLVPLAAVLDDVFINAERDEQTNVVEMDASEMANAMQTLDAEIPGAVVYRPGGNLGAGMNIVIRGLKSFTQRNDPLIFLDGIRVSDPNTTIRGERGFSALELINPDQIDRIEVLTGPDATTRYGLGARNGVILIYTKTR